MTVRAGLLFLLTVLSGMLNAQERIELADGSSLSVFLQLPEIESDGAPLVVLMGGGPGNLSISKDTANWLGSGFASRGWYVAVPVSPNNRSFRGTTNNQKIEQLIAVLQGRPDVNKGKTLLAGISNGGMSALEIAQKSPSEYLGVVAVPALFRKRNSGSSFDGLPIYLRIGTQDQLDWAQQFDDTVESLTDTGAILDAELLEGAAHMFRMDWSTLDPWLNNLK